MGRESKLIEELEALEDVQKRIDRVAEDYDSGKNRYRVIDAWKLGELLGLDFDSTSDWSRSSWCYRRDLAHGGFDYPFAENVELLQGKIPEDRYQQLAKLAEELIKKDGGPDLPLTKKKSGS